MVLHQVGERDRLLAAVQQDFLGPRGGQSELLEADPRFEYLAGVLAPRAADAVDLAGDASLTDLSEPAEHGGAAEPDEARDSDGADVWDLGISTPSLDPKSLPSSLGLSFLIRSLAHPELDLLLTFGRYEEERSNWRRRPLFLHTGVVLLRESQEWVSSDGMTLLLRSSRVDESLWRVTVFGVNNLSLPERRTRPEARELVFQPQIRVLLGKHAALAAFSSPRADGKAALETIDTTFRDRLAYARGHLCSAMWREVDPELDASGDGPDAYLWSAGGDERLPGKLREAFLRPDARTEYIPTYEVRAPDMRWEADHGSSPEFRAQILANTATGPELARVLKPLVDGYRDWISRKRTELTDSPSPEADGRSLDECDVAADRIERGIKTLEEDPDARLAFCFANKAISLQAGWQDESDEFAWHPFQLAFFLLNLPALADEGSDERSLFDLLWFPTGGGKTEAYLALTAFTLAYRRREANSQGEAHEGAGTGVLSRYTLRLLSLQQFRRAARLVTACEVLRTETHSDRSTTGWLPDGEDASGPVWGRRRFSIGLWVGGGLTPNSLFTRRSAPVRGRQRAFLGAIDLLRAPEVRRALLPNAIEIGDGAEPAQILECPACAAPTAVPTPYFAPGDRLIHFVFTSSEPVQVPSTHELSTADIDVRAVRVETVPSGAAGRVRSGRRLRSLGGSGSEP